jgi:CRP-like cAMP-binding protein
MKTFTTDDVLNHLENRRQIERAFQIGCGEMTRGDLAASIPCSYSTVNRLCHELLSDGKIKARWTHQHQSYWEAWFSLVE